MGQREKTFLGMAIVSAIVMLIAGGSDKVPGVAAMGLLLLLGAGIWAAIRDAAEKRKAAAPERHVRAVAVVVTQPQAPVFSEAEREEIVRRFLEAARPRRV